MWRAASPRVVKQDTTGTVSHFRRLYVLGHEHIEEDVLSLRIPNDQGALVPFSSFATAEWTAGPPSLGRYNGYPAMTVSGTAAPGESSGAALDEMERIASQLPDGIGFEWTGISYEENHISNEENRQALFDLGYKTTPVIVSEKGTVVGYSPTKLSEVLL